MASDVSDSSTTKTRSILEWSVVGIAAAAGIAIAVAGISYGLSNVTGVGAGFFPLVAGGAITLGAALWAFQLIGSARLRRHAATAAAPGAEDRHPTSFDADRVDPPTDTALGVLVVDGIDEEDDHIALPDRAGVLRVALVAVALVLAAVLLPILGYLLTMMLMLFAVMTLVSARRWWLALIVAAGVAIASRFVFEDLLGTALPHASIELLRTIGL
jgi:hypothetical protein